MKPGIYCAFAALVLLCSCGGTKRVVVGSKRSVEQNIVGEIVAQHLENHWDGEVGRRLNYGETPLLYQAMLSGDVTLYPEYSGTIVAEILKEPPITEPNVAFERARAEMKRTVQFEVLDPLGYDNRTQVVIRAADGENLKTVSDAASQSKGWRIGVTSEYELSASGLPRLNSYRLPQSAPVRGVNDPAELYTGLMDGSLTLIAGRASDGQLLATGWKPLEDDKGVFLPQQAALLVREDAFLNDSTLKPVLQRLSGKITLEAIRKMAAQVIVEERTPADVAREFLQEAGLGK